MDDNRADLKGSFWGEAILEHHVIIFPCIFRENPFRSFFFHISLRNANLVLFLCIFVISWVFWHHQFHKGNKTEVPLTSQGSPISLVPLAHVLCWLDPVEPENSSLLGLSRRVWTGLAHLIIEETQPRGLPRPEGSRPWSYQAAGLEMHI